MAVELDAVVIANGIDENVFLGTLIASHVHHHGRDVTGNCLGFTMEQHRLTQRGRDIDPLDRALVELVDIGETEGKSCRLASPSGEAIVLPSRSSGTLISPLPWLPPPARICRARTLPRSSWLPGFSPLNPNHSSKDRRGRSRRLRRQPFATVSPEPDTTIDRHIEVQLSCSVPSSTGIVNTACWP